jgi:hypothetical protein
MEEAVVSVESRRETDDDDQPGRTRLSAVLRWNISDSVQEILRQAARMARPRSQGQPPEFGTLKLLRQVVRFGIDREDKPENFPGATPLPLVFARWIKARTDSAAFNAEFIAPFERSRPEQDPEMVVLSRAVSKALAQARDIAKQTRNQPRVAARHLLAALLSSADTGGDRSVRLKWRTDLRVDIWDFAPDLLAAVEASPPPQEKLEAWRDVLAPLLERQHVDETRYHPDFGSDLPDREAKDSLGIQPDVDAFAQLICLTAAEPPISIGLFGDWGSGKSFFMEKLSGAIDGLTNRIEAGSAADFIKNVVQIRFNAWTYADSANLWASLTAEFFDQLRAGGYQYKGQARYKGIIDAVAKEVLRSKDEIATLGEMALKLDVTIKATNAQIDILGKARRAVPREGVKKEAAGFVDALRVASKQTLEDIGKQIGRPDLANDPEVFLDEAKAAATLFGKLRVICRVAANNRRAAIGLALVMVCTGAIGLLPFLEISLPQRSAVALGAVVTGIAAAFSTMRPVWHVVSTMIEAASRYAKDVETEIARIDAEMEGHRAALKEFQSQAAEAGKQQASRAAVVARYEAGANGQSPAALLHYFLHGTDETREYDKYLGIVSRVRRSFEALDALMRSRPQAAPASSDLPRIDRIVLYIDDLDRCRDQQVVQVLEALHLLLAFPLFVVVVGVDARWLQHSLAEHYKEQLSLLGDREGKATVTDYLEKIFQIPFWLQPIVSTKGGKEDRYNRLIDDLLEPRTRDGPNRPGESSEGPTGAATSGSAHPIEAKEPESRPSPDPEDLQQPKGAADDLDRTGQANAAGLSAQTPAAAGNKPTVRTPAETHAAMVLEDAEKKLMKALGPLVGKSPRAVRRFVNLYRLIRARRHGRELRRFLGQDGREPEFPAFMFLLGMETGLHSKETDTFYWLIEDHLHQKPDHGDWPVATLLIQERPSKIDAPHLAALSPVRKRLVQATEDVALARGGVLRIKHVRAAASEVTRYSFRPQARSSPSPPPPSPNPGRSKAKRSAGA